MPTRPYMLWSLLCLCLIPGCYLAYITPLNYVCILLFLQYTTNALLLGPCTFSFPTAWRILFRCAPCSLPSGFSSDTTFSERPYLTILSKIAAWTSPFSVLLSYFIFLLSPYNHVFIYCLPPTPFTPTISRQSPRDLCWFWRDKGAEIEWCLEYRKDSNICQMSKWTENRLIIRSSYSSF